MFIRDIRGLERFTAGDGSLLRELINPEKDDVRLGYSLAHATVGPGETTLLHRLNGSEVYYIIEGEGMMEIDGETAGIVPGTLVYIPPGSLQRIRNAGLTDLVFLCLVDPAWKISDEEVLG